MEANLYVQMTLGKVGKEPTKRFGWHESNQAKFDLSEALRNHLKTEFNRVYCAILLDECATWVKHEGKVTIGPEDSTKFGDCVIAAGLVVQADLFMGGSPKQIQPPIEGWRKRIQDKGKSEWVM
jgi:hypothetical protein